MNELPKKLLAADEPAPVMVYNADGESPFVLVADHADNIMPRALGRLGMAERNANGTSPWTSALPVSAGFWRTRSDAMLIQQNSCGDIHCWLTLGRVLINRRLCGWTAAAAHRPSRLEAEVKARGMTSRISIMRQARSDLPFPIRCNCWPTKRSNNGLLHVRSGSKRDLLPGLRLVRSSLEIRHWTVLVARQLRAQMQTSGS